MPKSDNKNKPFDLEKYKNDFVGSMTYEFFKLVEIDTGQYGMKFEEDILLGLVSSLVSTGLFRKLKRDFDPGSVPFKQARGEFLEFKSQLQNGLATAFQSAFQHYSGEELEYYCQIQQVSDPANKLPC